MSRPISARAPAEQPRASGLSADVAGGQIKAVTTALGQHAHSPAVASYLHGFEAALITASVILIAAGALGFLGLRRLRQTPEIVSASEVENVGGDRGERS